MERARAVALKGLKRSPEMKEYTFALYRGLVN